ARTTTSTRALVFAYVLSSQISGAQPHGVAFSDTRAAAAKRSQPKRRRTRVERRNRGGRAERSRTDGKSRRVDRMWLSTAASRRRRLASTRAPPQPPAYPEPRHSSGLHH